MTDFFRHFYYYRN